ncbi:unnamed protein product [Moneuplotes crassus]|uniref:Uncharacterized protein n=1 Tax=Euplotes crassus TaxID=5936 RepID=A0AAD1U5V7_EUPCR|nr:unnamed protein product [Moneuplotes crassus]
MERRCNSQVLKFPNKSKPDFGIGTTFDIMHHHEFTQMTNKSRINRIVDQKTETKQIPRKSSPFMVKTQNGTHEGTVEIPTKFSKDMNSRSGLLCKIKQKNNSQTTKGRRVKESFPELVNFPNSDIVFDQPYQNSQNMTMDRCNIDGLQQIISKIITKNIEKKRNSYCKANSKDKPRQFSFAYQNNWGRNDKLELRPKASVFFTTGLKQTPEAQRRFSEGQNNRPREKSTPLRFKDYETTSQTRTQVEKYQCKNLFDAPGKQSRSSPRKKCYLKSRKTVAFRHKGDIIYSDSKVDDQREQGNEHSKPIRNKFLSNTHNLGKTLGKFAKICNLLPGSGKKSEEKSMASSKLPTAKKNVSVDTQTPSSLFKMNRLDEKSVGSIAREIIKKSKIKQNEPLKSVYSKHNKKTNTKSSQGRFKDSTFESKSLPKNHQRSVHKVYSEGVSSGLKNDTSFTPALSKSMDRDHPLQDGRLDINSHTHDPGCHNIIPKSTQNVQGSSKIVRNDSLESDFSIKIPLDTKANSFILNLKLLQSRETQKTNFCVIGNKKNKPQGAHIKPKIQKISKLFSSNQQKVQRRQKTRNVACGENKQEKRTIVLNEKTPKLCTVESEEGIAGERYPQGVFNVKVVKR